MLGSAAAKGSYKCALRILDGGAAVDAIDHNRSRQETELHTAAIKGHANVTKLLLVRGAKVTLKNRNDKNALELAIDHNNISVAKAILDSDCWRKAMKGMSYRDDKDALNTPMRMLIRRFPSLATKVLDNCITPVDSDEDEDEDDDIQEKMKKKPKMKKQKKIEDPFEEDHKKPTNKQNYKFDFTFLEDAQLKEGNKKLKSRHKFEKGFANNLEHIKYFNRGEEYDEGLASTWSSQKYISDKYLYAYTTTT